MTSPKDGTNDPHPGGGESGGGAWPGENEKPADPDADVVTHVVRETAEPKDRPGGYGNIG